MAAKPSLGTPPANLPALVPAGSHAGNTPLLLKKLVALAGSQEKCHLRLMSSTVSKYHALVITYSDGVYIRDLASRTKVQVNGQPVREAWLHDGDHLQIGKFLFQFTTPHAGAAMPVPAPSATMVVGGRTSPEPIHGLVVLIGRQNGCDIKLRDDSVSSRHAVIFEAAGKRYIRDLNSRTGTYVNGNKIHLQEIEFIDEIRIGETKLNLKPFQTEEFSAEALPEALPEFEPLPFELEAKSAESEPLPFETEARSAESEPLPFETEATPFEREPLPFETEASSADSEPLPFDSEGTPVESEPEPLPVETQATSAEPEPLPVEQEMEEPAVGEPISLAPPDEPIPLAPEPAHEPEPELRPEPLLRDEPPPLSEPAPPPRRPFRPEPIFSSELVSEPGLPPEPAPPPAQARRPTPVRPATPVRPPTPAPRVEIIPMHPPTGSVIQLRPNAPVAWPPRPAAPQPSPAEPAKPAAQAAPPIESPAPVPPRAEPVISAPPPAEPVAPVPPIQLRPSAPLPAEPPRQEPQPEPPVEIRAPAPQAPEPIKPAPQPAPPIEVPQPVRAASPAPAPAAPLPPVQLRPSVPSPVAPSPVETARPALQPAASVEFRTPPPAQPVPEPQRPAARVESVSSAPPQTTAIQLRAAPPASKPPAAPPEPLGERPSWTDRANVKRVPPSAADSQTQRPQPPPAHIDDPVVDVSAQFGADDFISATFDDEAAQQASEPPLIATGLNLDIDRQSARSDDMLFVEEDFTQALPLPPEIFGPPPVRTPEPRIAPVPAKPAALIPPKSPAAESPTARLQMPREDFAQVVKPPAAPQPVAPIMPKAPAVESPIAGLQMRREEPAQVVKPSAAPQPVAPIAPKAPAVDAPTVQAVKPPVSAAPAAPPPAVPIAPKAPAVDSPIVGLQVRPEDFANIVPPAGTGTAASGEATSTVAPKPPAAESPIPGLQIRREDFAPAAQPPSREINAPAAAAPSAAPKIRPEGSREPAGTAAAKPSPAAAMPAPPQSTPPAQSTPPPQAPAPRQASVPAKTDTQVRHVDPPQQPVHASPVKSPVVESPIPGLQIRAEDFATAAQAADREIKSPAAAAPSATAKVVPQGFVDLREPARADAAAPKAPPAAPRAPATPRAPAAPPRAPAPFKHDEVLDLDEPWQPALDLDLELPSLASDDKPLPIQVEDLGDTAFTQIVENFSGDATGPLIDTSPPLVDFESESIAPPMQSFAAQSHGAAIEPPRDISWQSEAVAGHTKTAATADASAFAQLPPDQSGVPAIEQAQDVPPVQLVESNVEQPHGVPQESAGIEEPTEPAATAGIVPSSELGELPAAQFAEPHIEPPASIEPEPTTILPPAEIAATTDTASATPPIASPPTAPPAAPKTGGAPLSAIGGAAPAFIANLDHFLGGMPMKLPDLPAPPKPSARRLEVSFGDRPPPSQPQPEPASPLLDAGPEMIQTRPPPKAVRTRSQPGKAAPFATTSNISADQAAAPTDSTTDEAGGEKPPERLTSIFEGLAMTPIHEKDVFSDFEATALNDAAFGGARLSKADDFVLPESPENASRLSSGPTEDFAESDFWERTDEQEGVPPMGVPKPEDYVVKDTPVSATAAAPIEEPLAPPSETPVETAGEPLVGVPEVPVGAGAVGGRNIPPEDPTRSRPLPRGPGVPPPQRPSEPPGARKRRRKLIPFLMLAMLLSMAAAYAAIWFGIRPRSHVYGSMTFLNYDWVPATGDGIEFESTQRRLLAADDTRKHAVDLLGEQNPQFSAGFLQVPDLYGRVVRSIALSTTRVNGTPQTQIKLSYDGADEAGDRTRMGALLQAMIDANAQTLDTGRRVQEDADRARRAVDDAAAQIEQTRTQIAGLQRTVDEDPSADRLAEVSQRQSDLERARFAAEDAVDIDRANQSRLQAAAVAANVGDGAGSTTRPGLPASDPQLQEMRRQMLDLNAQLQAVKRAQTIGVTQARDQLEDAVKQFNDELTSAGGVLDDGSPLKQFVNSAKDSQSKAHELITMLMVDGEDLEKQLEDTRREAEDLIQTRQQEVWSGDAHLQDLTAKRDSAQHRFNANVGEGINDPVILEPLQTEIATLNDQIKARQAQLGVGPGEVKLAKGLARVIDSLRDRLQREKQQIDDVLDPLEKQLKDLDPTVAALPDSQRALAQQIRQRLATLNEARRTYADAVGAGATAPSTVETDLQKRIDDLKARFDERQSNLAEQIQKSVGDESATRLAEAQRKLDADKKALDAAKSAYNAARVEYDNQTARHADAQTAMGSMQLAKDQLAQQTRALDQLRHDQEQKADQADHSFDIKPFAESDVTSTATDSRRDYCIYAIVGLAVVFAFLVLAASQPASGEIPIANTFPQPAADAKPPTADEPHHDSDDDAEMLTTA